MTLLRGHRASHLWATEGLRRCRSQVRLNLTSRSQDWHAQILPKDQANLIDSCPQTYGHTVPLAVGVLSQLLTHHLLQIMILGLISDTRRMLLRHNLIICRRLRGLTCLESNIVEMHQLLAERRINGRVLISIRIATTPARHLCQSRSL